MGFFRKFWEIFGGKEELSDLATQIGSDFDEESEGAEFFNHVFALFINFDTDGARRNKVSHRDVRFIAECTLASLSSNELINKFSTRVDSYFYIYRRLEEYDIFTKHDKLPSLKHVLFRELSKVFVESSGSNPNLYVKNEDQLRMMNIVQHLNSIPKIDRETTDIFFVLCKLSFQASMLTRDNLTWTDIVSKIHDFGGTIEEFIGRYVYYKQAFTDFPLDLPGFIELIRRYHPPKESTKPLIIIFKHLCQSLGFKPDEFFQQYRIIFETRIKQKSYTLSQIGELFHQISHSKRLFDLYFSFYTANVDLDSLWKVFIRMCINYELNAILEEYFISKLSDSTVNATVASFLRYAKLVEQLELKPQQENRSCLMRIFEKIFDTFINTYLNDERHCDHFSDYHLKTFLRFGLELSSTGSLERPSCLKIIHHLIFVNNNHQLNAADKIQSLVNKLNDFDQDLCKNNDPVFIIQDEWLQDYLLVIPRDLRCFNSNVYRYLCENHRNNPWTIHIWDKLVASSILRSKGENINEVLLQLDHWMNTIKHGIYDVEDTLTTILIVNLSELILFEYRGPILSLPNITYTINFLLHCRENQCHRLNIKLVDEFIDKGQKSIEQILLLQGHYTEFQEKKMSLEIDYLLFSILGTCSIYRELLHPSIAPCFLRSTNITKILELVDDPRRYQFPRVTSEIQFILSNTPEDINISRIDTNEEYFRELIDQVNQWLNWFDKFLFVFSSVVEQFRIWRVIEATQLLDEMRKAKDHSLINVVGMKRIMEKTLRFLRPLGDLRRLCHLLNCSTEFQLIDSGRLNHQIDSSSYIRELKKFQLTNYFQVAGRSTSECIIPLNDRQHVRWSIACEKISCHLQIKFQVTNIKSRAELFFNEENVSIDKHILQGEFETQQAGQLIIVINNDTSHSPRTIWYRVHQVPLAASHLFHGIFDMHYEKYYKDSFRITNDELNRLLDEVFQFIDRFLSGEVRLKEIDELRTVFCNKNIDVRKEVKKMFTNRRSQEETNNQRTTMTAAVTTVPTDIEIDQVCHRLQIYQYYSHINIIIDCIKRFHILSVESDDHFIKHLKLLYNENPSLKDISETFQILKKQFEMLTSQHLQLIKTAVECSAVVQMMKDSDLYSSDGRRRFRELQDNLTTQFQFQERNNMILNSWIITYELSGPFVLEANSFDEFINRIAQLSNFEKNSIKHMQSKVISCDCLRYFSFLFLFSCQ